MQGMHIPSGTRELGMPLVSPKLRHPLDESSKWFLMQLFALSAVEKDFSKGMA